MAHAARSMSPKERRDAKNARILIGREDQQDLFTRSLLQPEHREAKIGIETGKGPLPFGSMIAPRIMVQDLR